ncbi:MAG TPA: hypothetical protein VJV78_43875 [Polyangiales bacterium]|nr:hypothetical protein [Polyangiales bacterium]
MLLTDLFWICLCLPGYALARRLWPAIHEAGLLSVIAFSVLGGFLVMSPVSMLGYALGAPVGLFSGALALTVVAGGAFLVRARADRELLACLRREPVVGWLALFALLWLQARVGSYFSGDATFHLGRVRVLLQHGFTNRDIYLADYHFQHIYHTNLLYPLYASLSQLTGQTFLEAWFYSQAWAKLLVAAGHYALGWGVTRRRFVAWLLALTMITANAGETYTAYPNMLAVGWLLPLLLGSGFSLLTPDPPPRQAWAVAAAALVLGQVHALYAVYAGLALAPGLQAALLWPRLPVRRSLIAFGLLGTLLAAPFLLVSQFGFRPQPKTDPPAAVVAQPAAAPAPAPAAPPAPRERDLAADVGKGKAAVPTPAVAAGGGHLEKGLELNEQTGLVYFGPDKMGGTGFIALGCAGFLLALIGAGMRRLDQPLRRGPLMAAAFGALPLSLVLFIPKWTTLALDVLQQAFTVARLSTVLSSLLLLGACAGVGALIELTPSGKPRRVSEALVLLFAIGAATRLTGHAPLFFGELVQMARAPREQRYATLEMLEARRQMLERVVPPGTTVLTTARFARTVVMLCDCYVIIADRGHTYVSFSQERRDQLVLMNGLSTPWDQRVELLKRYGLSLVVFESRHLRRIYRWTHEHGKVIGEAAGLEVVQLQL